MHESKAHQHNTFITLTYNNDHLPKNGSLIVKHFQDFMKRLRRHREYEDAKDHFYGELETGIRFFHCGEYGEKFARPHYHAILFNCDFKDKQPLRKTREGHILYKSEKLSQLWTHGFSTIGDVSFESAAYVARYITKKVTGEKAIHHYNTINYQTGEVLNERKPEYVTMSRRPGIGRTWFENYTQDIYPDDFVLMKGKKLKVPKYYDTQYEILYPEEMAKIKAKRAKDGKLRADNNTIGRLMVREEVHLNKANLLNRKYENET